MTARCRCGLIIGSSLRSVLCFLSYPGQSMSLTLTTMWAGALCSLPLYMECRESTKLPTRRCIWQCPGIRTWPADQWVAPSATGLQELRKEQEGGCQGRQPAPGDRQHGSRCSELASTVRSLPSLHPSPWLQRWEGGSVPELCFSFLLAAGAFSPSGGPISGHGLLIPDDSVFGRSCGPAGGPTPVSALLSGDLACATCDDCVWHGVLLAHTDTPFQHSWTTQRRHLPPSFPATYSSKTFRGGLLSISLPPAASIQQPNFLLRFIL